MVVKQLSLFGPQEQVEYYISRALDYQGWPTTKHATKVELLQMLFNWRFLKFVITSSGLFKPHLAITLAFPYERPPQGFVESLEGILWNYVDVEVTDANI